MQNRYGYFQRANGVYYALDLVSQRQTSLKTREEAEAKRLIAAKNQAADTPQLNLSSFKCPALVGIDDNAGAIVPFFVRTLSSADVKALRKHTQTAIRNCKRFQLFLIVKRNYAEWLRYTLALLKPIDGLSEDEQVELDRLLMNFLSSARSLIDHFAQYHKQTFRKTADETKYAEYLVKLETNSWAFWLLVSGRPQVSR